MLNFCSLYSGSSGNSLFVETQNTKLLVDAGVSCKKIENALQDIKVDPSSIDGILITHEHTDHVQGLGTLSRKFDLPVFVNQETLDAMPKQKDKIPDKNIKTFKISDKFERDFPGTKIIKLEQNYRCTGNILKAANSVIKNNEVKYKKELWTQNEEGNLPRVYQAQNEYDEGTYIVDQMDKMTKFVYILH